MGKTKIPGGALLQLCTCPLCFGSVTFAAMKHQEGQSTKTNYWIKISLPSGGMCLAQATERVLWQGRKAYCLQHQDLLKKHCVAVRRKNGCIPGTRLFSSLQELLPGAPDKFPDLTQDTDAKQARVVLGMLHLTANSGEVPVLALPRSIEGVESWTLRDFANAILSGHIKEDGSVVFDPSQRVPRTIEQIQEAEQMQEAAQMAAAAVAAAQLMVPGQQAGAAAGIAQLIGLAAATTAAEQAQAAAQAIAPGQQAGAGTGVGAGTGTAAAAQATAPGQQAGVGVGQGQGQGAGTAAAAQATAPGQQAGVGVRQGQGQGAGAGTAAAAQATAPGQQAAAAATSVPGTELSAKEVLEREVEDIRLKLLALVPAENTGSADMLLQKFQQKLQQLQAHQQDQQQLHPISKHNKAPSTPGDLFSRTASTINALLCKIWPLWAKLHQLGHGSKETQRQTRQQTTTTTANTTTATPSPATHSPPSRSPSPFPKRPRTRTASLSQGLGIGLQTRGTLARTKAAMCQYGCQHKVLMPGCGLSCLAARDTLNSYAAEYAHAAQEQARSSQQLAECSGNNRQWPYSIAQRREEANKCVKAVIRKHMEVAAIQHSQDQLLQASKLQGNQGATQCACPAQHQYVSPYKRQKTQEQIEQEAEQARDIRRAKQVSLIDELRSVAEGQATAVGFITQEDIKHLQHLCAAFIHAQKPDKCDYCSGRNLAHQCQLPTIGKSTNAVEVLQGFCQLVLSQSWHLFLELFSGTGFTANQAQAMGLFAVTSDWVEASELQVDYADPRQMWLVSFLMRAALLSGHLTATHAGVECDSWSQANKSSSRSKSAQQGDAMKAAAPALTEMKKFAACITIENPRGSAVWVQDEVEEVCPYRGHCDYCKMGGHTKKPTTIGSSHEKLGLTLAPFLEVCRGDCLWKANGFPHPWWDQNNASGDGLQNLRSVYPPKLSHALALAHVSEIERIKGVMRAVVAMSYDQYRQLCTQLKV